MSYNEFSGLESRRPWSVERRGNESVILDALGQVIGHVERTADATFITETSDLRAENEELKAQANAAENALAEYEEKRGRRREKRAAHLAELGARAKEQDERIRKLEDAIDSLEGESADAAELAVAREQVLLKRIERLRGYVGGLLDLIDTSSEGARVHASYFERARRSARLGELPKAPSRLEGLPGLAKCPPPPAEPGEGPSRVS